MTSNLSIHDPQENLHSTASAVGARSNSELVRACHAPTSGLAVAWWRQSPGDIRIEADQVQENVLVYHRAGSMRVRKLSGGRVVGDRSLLRGISIVPARRDTAWQLDGSVEVVHVYLDQGAFAPWGDAAGSHAFALCEVFAQADPLLACLIESIVLASPDLAAAPELSDAFLADQLSATLVSHVATRYGSGAVRTDTSAGKRPWSLAPWRLARVEELVRQHLSESLTLEALAAAAGLEKHHFLRAFKAMTGDTPHRWLTKQRLDAAMKRLQKGDEPLSAIAASTGFSSASHLCHTWRRTYGGSPVSMSRLRGGSKRRSAAA